MKKNKVFDLIARLIYPTALYFTVITLTLYIAGSLMSTGSRNMIPTLRTILLTLCFSFVIDVANILLTVKKLHLSLRIALHYVLLTASFLLLFFNAADFDPSRGLIIVAGVAFTVLYAIICAVTFAVRGAVKKSKTDSSEYHSIYDKHI